MPRLGHAHVGPGDGLQYFSVTGRVLAAAVLGCLPLSAAPAVALPSPAPAALRTSDVPATLEAEPATPLEGAAEIEDAVELEEGRYEASARATGGSFERHYRYSMDDPAGVLRITALSSRHDAKVYVNVLSPDRLTCGSEDSGLAFEPMPSATVAVVQRVEDCAADGEVVIRLSGYAEGVTDYELWVVEEPEVTDQGWSVVGRTPRGKPDVPGDGVAVEGGEGPLAATVVGPGRWESTIRSGEVHWYAFPVRYGQSVNARVVVDTFDDGDFVTVSSDLFDPMLGSVTGGQLATGTSFQDAEIQLVSPPLSAARRGDGPDWSSLAGFHRIAVAVDEFDSDEVGYRVEIEVAGDPQDGPVHAGGDPWAYDVELGLVDAFPADGGRPGGASGGAEEPGATAGEPSRTTTRQVAGGVVGALGLAAVVAGVLLQVRRSRATA